MSAIGTYLWWLAPAFLKKAVEGVSLVWQLLMIIGEELDEVKATILAMRRQLLVASAEGIWLDAHGRDRDIDRISGESDESYRARLLAAWLVKQRGGTIPGMVEGCELLGLTVQVDELYDTDPARWAEFQLVVRAGELNVLNQSIFFDTVRELKPAHTKPVYVVELPLDEFDDGEHCDDGNFFDEFVDAG